jgi:hypothetical protein
MCHVGVFQERLRKTTKSSGELAIVSAETRIFRIQVYRFTAKNIINDSNMERNI